MKETETMARDRIVERLKNLGLSTHEAEVYAALLNHPTMTASALCKDTGISDTKIYYALDGLLEKGMLTVRNANPKVYIAAAPKEAIANLKQRLVEKLNEEIQEADILANLLSPIYESAEKPDNLEVGYIITGQGNIINRMKALIGTTRREITLFVAYPELFKVLESTLRGAKERQVKLNVSMTEEMFKTENVKNLGDLRQLCCATTLLISDLKTLITVSDWTLSETAMLSQDQNLIRMARDYFENSMCYSP